MIIKLEQLKNYLSTPTKSIYVITGSEILLVEETIAYLKKWAIKNGFDEHQSLQITPHFNWQELSIAEQTLSLFSTKKILELDLSSGKPGKDGAEALSNYCESPNADILLIVRLPKLTAAQQKAKWFSAVEKNGLVIQIWPINKTQLPQWLQRRLQRANLRTDSAGINLLAELTQDNLLAAKQSIEKLSLLYGTGNITAQQITECLNDNSYFDVYHLVSACLQLDFTAVTKILSQLKAVGTEPALILWVIYQEIRILAELAYLIQQKQTLEIAWRKHNIWPQRQVLLKQHLQQFSYTWYLSLIQHAAQCDAILKGAIAGNIWQDLQQLLLMFSNKTYQEIA